MPPPPSPLNVSNRSNLPQTWHTLGPPGWVPAQHCRLGQSTVDCHRWELVSQGSLLQHTAAPRRRWLILYLLFMLLKFLKKFCHCTLSTYPGSLEDSPGKESVSASRPGPLGPWEEGSRNLLTSPSCSFLPGLPVWPATEKGFLDSEHRVL